MQPGTETWADRIQYLRVFDEFLVPARCGARIRYLNNAANADRLLDKGAHVGRSFLCVTIEERLRRQPFQHPMKLPRKIGRIAHARTQALPKERWRLVRGVTCQQHAAPAPVLRNYGAEGIQHRALDASLTRRN